MDLNAAGLLYALGASLALAWLRRPADLRWWAVGWLLGLGLFCSWGLRPPLVQVPTTQGALTMAMGMGVLLLRTPKTWAVLGGAGLLSAAWTSALQALYPTALASLLPMALALLTAFLHLRSERFCPPLMRQEACLLLLVLGQVGGLVPDLWQGWNSTAAIRAGDIVDDQTRQSIQIPLLLSAASVVLGLLYARWRYR